MISKRLVGGLLAITTVFAAIYIPSVREGVECSADDNRVPDPSGALSSSFDATSGVLTRTHHFVVQDTDIIGRAYRCDLARGVWVRLTGDLHWDAGAVSEDESILHPLYGRCFWVTKVNSGAIHLADSCDDDRVVDNFDRYQLAYFATVDYSDVFRDLTANNRLDAFLCRGRLNGVLIDVPEGKELSDLISDKTYEDAHFPSMSACILKL